MAFYKAFTSSFHIFIQVSVSSALLIGVHMYMMYEASLCCVVWFSVSLSWNKRLRYESERGQEQKLQIDL